MSEIALLPPFLRGEDLPLSGVPQEASSQRQGCTIRVCDGGLWCGYAFACWRAWMPVRCRRFLPGRRRPPSCRLYGLPAAAFRGSAIWRTVPRMAHARSPVWPRAGTAGAAAPRSPSPRLLIRASSPFCQSPSCLFRPRRWPRPAVSLSAPPSAARRSLLRTNLPVCVERSFSNVLHHFHYRRFPCSCKIPCSGASLHAPSH